MAKIDILLPYWGEPALLKKSIQSVLAQTEPDFRLLIFDDFYPSNEAEKYCKALKDPRVIYTRNPSNLGITKNFNLALNHTKAKYCVMMGCDDIMLPNYIEMALKNIGSAEFYQPNVEIIDNNDNIYLPLGDKIKKILRPKKAGIYSGEKLAASLCNGNWLYFPSITWLTKSIKKYGFDDKYKIVEDVILELNTIKDGGKLYLDNETTFQYRRFNDSLSSKEKSKGGVRFAEEKAVYNRYAMTFEKLGWKKASHAAKLRITSRIHKLIS